MAKASVSKKIPNLGFKGLFDRIDCDTGLIFVDTPEETRLIREIYRKYKTQDIQFWSLGHGLHKIKEGSDPDTFLPHQYPKNAARASKDGSIKSQLNVMNALSIIEEDSYDKIKNEQDGKKSIYILRDADKFLVNNPAPLRAVRDIIYLTSCASSTIIISGFGISVPDDVSKDSCFVKLSYPTMEEINSVYIPMIQGKIDYHNKNCAEEEKIDTDFSKEAIARACAGLTEDQIINVFQYTTTIDKKLNIDRILEEKKAIINKSDILEYWVCDDKLENVGGFKELKAWFDIRKIVMTNPEEAKEFKAKLPKGIMLLGCQGSGKTFCGKAVAQNWGLGLIKLDMGKVFAGLVGESVSPDTEFTFYTDDDKIIRISAETAFHLKDTLLGTRLRVQSFSKEGKVELQNVTNIIQHKRQKKLVRVSTKSGRFVDVTEDHSLFTISDNGKLTEMKPSEMIPGNVIAVPSNFDNKIMSDFGETHLQNFIDILPLISENEKDKWMLVDPIKHLGNKLFEVTLNKNWTNYRNGAPLNLKNLPSYSILSPDAKIKAQMTDKEHPIRLYLNENLMELFGWYTAEGSITGDRLRLHINESEDEIIKDLTKKCGFESYSYQDGDSHGKTVFFGDTGLKRIFDYLGLVNKERLPSWILGTSLEQRRRYLKGLFSGDGGISGSHIEISQSRKMLCYDILNLLSSVGIFASMYPRIDGGNRIIIHSSMFKKKFMNEVRFTQQIKQDLLETLFNDDDWGHKVPFFKDLKSKTNNHSNDMSSSWISYKNAINLDPSIKEWDIFYDIVKSIEILDEQPEFVYDISVNKNENFIAGNIICHNSEKRTRQALAQIEAAGGVVIVDEIDKGLSGAGSSDKTDGGTTSRVIGTLLTWLQEDHPGVFLILTANDISSLLNNHPELLRKGRIDEVWFSDIPNFDERKEIYSIHLSRNGRDVSKFDLDVLGRYEFVDDAEAKTYPPTGAEIEYAIGDAIQDKFAMAKKKSKKLVIGGEDDITTEDILSKLKLIKPISFVAKDTIRKMRTWCKVNARSVSGAYGSEVKEKTKKTKIDLRSTDISL